MEMEIEVEVEVATELIISWRLHTSMMGGGSCRQRQPSTG